MTALRFAAIGINHDHIYAQVDSLLKAGGELVSFHAVEDHLADTIRGPLLAGAAHR